MLPYKLLIMETLEVPKKMHANAVAVGSQLHGKTVLMDNIPFVYRTWKDKSQSKQKTPTLLASFHPSRRHDACY